MATATKPLDETESQAKVYWCHKYLENDVTHFLVNRTNPTNQRPPPAASWPPTSNEAASMVEIEQQGLEKLGATDDATWVIWRAGIGVRVYYVLNHGINVAGVRCPSSGSYANLACIRNEQLLNYLHINRTCKSLAPGSPCLL